MTTRITILVDNETCDPGLGTEHGLALWIEHRGHRVLFDTGQSDLVLKNADALNVPVDSAQAVILSHGHYDHAGGLPGVLQRAPGAPVYTGDGATRPRYSLREPNNPRMIGLDPETLYALARHPGGMLYPRRPIEVTPGLWVSGPIPRTCTGEPMDEPFYLDSSGSIKDTIPDEQALWMETDNGLAVITGCAHAGVVNTLSHARHHMPSRPITALVGGLHLGNAPETRLRLVEHHLEGLPLTLLAAGHCTGAAPRARLQRLLGERAVPFCAGAVLELF